MYGSFPSRTLGQMSPRGNNSSTIYLVGVTLPLRLAFMLEYRCVSTTRLNSKVDKGVVVYVEPNRYLQLK